MRDGPLRRGLKAVARWHWELELRVHRAWRLWRGERPWVLSGDCGRCAACCEEPAIAVGRATWYLASARSAFLAWQRHVNGFELLRAEREGHVLVFRCTHFDAATRTCDSYDSRPGMCRDYPRLLLWQADPRFLPRCAYRAVSPRAEGLRRALDAVPLTAAQRERLRDGLRLGDDGPRR
jgi:hypothetical protein